MTKAEQILEENGWEIGDLVVRENGEAGVIVDICKCDQCEKRGFYELCVDWGDGVDDCITNGEWERTGLSHYKFYKPHKTKTQREIEAIAEVIEMGKCYFGADPAYFNLPDAHYIELAQARALYEAGYRKINT